MKKHKQKVLIVGGGFGGIKAALDLIKEDIFDITLLSDDDNFSYFPSLYHTATGGSRDVSSIPLVELLDPKKVTLVKGLATGIDRAQKHIITSDGQELSYDYLILSMGAITNFFHIPGLPELAYGIKSLEDAEKLKRHLHQQIIDDRKPDLNYVVVGGGPSGIELAGVLGDYVRYICDKHGIKRRAVHVDLIESAPRLAARMSPSISRKIAKRLRAKGVRLYLGSAVQGQTADELTVNGKSIRSHTVIWTAGMSNNPFFAANNFQLNRNGKVRVDQFLQAEPSIFVIGDNADTAYSGMAQTAIHDASYVAQSLLVMVAQSKSPRPYVAKRPIYVLPAGPNWAAVSWGSARIYGIVGWVLRRSADFLAYNDYESFFRATRRWFSEYERQDLCDICQKTADVAISKS